MSYLLDLVKSLDEDELRQFTTLDVVGKEQLVRDTYAQHAREKKFSEPALPAKLGITKSHFDKINSLLVDKALVHLAGTNFKDKLEFIAAKQLYDFVLHELKLNEKKLKRIGDKSALKDFYAHAFRMTQLFNFNDFRADDLEYYGNSYVRLLSKNEEGEKYRSLARLHEMVIRYFSGRKNGTAKRDQSLKQLLKLQKEISKKNFPEAEMGICFGLSAYYEGIDVARGLAYLEDAATAMKKGYDRISDRDKGFVLAMLGQQLIDLSRFGEGIAKYEELFSKFAHVAGTRLYHPYQYVFALLIVKDFTRAAAIMKKYMEPILKNENARNFHFDILRLYAIYHLLDHDLDKAGKCLQQIQQFGKEDFTPLGDVLFRLVHNVYCIQTGDYALAADMLKKNMKYIDSKIYLEAHEEYKKLFLDLGKVIRFKSKKTKNPLHEIDPREGKARLYVELITLPLRK